MLGQSRQRNQKFKVILSYIASLRVLSNPISPQGPGHRHLGESLSRTTLASLKLLVSHPRYLSLILIPKHLMFP